MVSCRWPIARVEDEELDNHGRANYSVGQFVRAISLRITRSEPNGTETRLPGYEFRAIGDAQQKCHPESIVCADEKI